MKGNNSRAAIWRRFELTNPILLLVGSGGLVKGFDWAAQATGWSVGFEGLGQMALAGAITWALTLVLALHKHVDDLAAQRMEVMKAVELCARLEGRREQIAELERNMRTVDLERGPVLKGYCEKFLQEALEMSRNAAEMKRVLVREHHFGTVEEVLSAFEKGENNEYRCVWRIPAGDAAYDEHWKNYMRYLLGVNAKGKENIKIHMLVIVDFQEELARPNIMTICGYMHQEKETFEYAVLDKAGYERRLRDAQLETNFSDFGIYGGVLMYRTIDEDEQTGEFTEDGVMIQRYDRFHRDTMRAYDEMKARPRIAKMLRCRGVISGEDFIDADDIRSETKT